MKRILKMVNMKMLVVLAAVTVLSACINVNVSLTKAEAASVSKALSKKTADIAAKKTKKSDSEKVKIRKLFKYCTNTWQYERAERPVTKSVAKSFALSNLKNGKGSCYHFAAAFAYLVKAATGYSVRIASGETNGFGYEHQQHAWTEVKIGNTWYVCDVNLDKFGVDPKGMYSGTYCLKRRSKLKKTYYGYQNTVYINC